MSQVQVLFVLWFLFSSGLYQTLILPQGGQRLPGEREKGNHIKPSHQANSHISQVPYEGIGRHTAHTEHDQRQELIGGLGHPVVSAQIRNVGPGIKKNSDKG